MLKKYAFALSFLLSSVAHADLEENKSVSLLHVKTDGSVVFAVKNPDKTKACFWSLIELRNLKTTPVIDSVTFEALYSGLLAAQRAGSPVTIDFTTTGGGVCKLNYINFL